MFTFVHGLKNQVITLVFVTDTFQQDFSLFSKWFEPIQFISIFFCLTTFCTNQVFFLSIAHVTHKLARIVEICLTKGAVQGTF